MLFVGPNFEVEFDPADRERSFTGKATVEVDLTYCNIMDYLRRAIFEGAAGGYVAKLASWQPDLPAPYPPWPPTPVR